MTTAQALRDLKPGIFKTLEKVEPIGALQARKQASGAIALYWRYSIGDHSERVPIGVYDSSAPPKSYSPTSKGYSLAAAIARAEAMAKEHHQHRDEGGRPALLALRDEEAKAAAEERQQAAHNTLQRLLEDYCDHLESLGRRSHRDARSIFNLHVVEAWPKLAKAPARGLTAEQFADMMRKLLEAGKGRTANKMRSYARAAFQTAKAAKSKPSIPVRFKAYGIVLNPVADTSPEESANKPDKKPLKADEMRVYWRAIRDLPGFKGAVLRLHLLTGAQRIEQLVKLKTIDVTADTITLFDSKGRPGQAPRPHTVPLIKHAAKALAECGPHGVYAISTDPATTDEQTHLAATTLSAWAAEAIGDAVKDFKTKRLRSGVETLLASVGISTEIRGRLQSHGVSGVQARHYDGHLYIEEKRKALEALHRLLEDRHSSVTPIRRRAA